MLKEDTGVLFHRNFNSILRRDHQKKIPYERRSNESVDEKSLSNLVLKGLRDIMSY